jgi:DNA polymerase III delta subunit
MKVILLHGDHSLDSYNRLQKLVQVAKERGWEIIKTGSSDNLTLPEKFTTSNLFEGERLYVVENLAKIKKAELVWFKKNIQRLSGTTIIYHGNTITNNFLKLIPKASKIEEYKLPKLIFKFLESFWPGNSTNSIKLLHEVIKSESPEFVFNLLSRHLRDLYWVILDKDSMSYPGWRISKLTQQTKRFTNGKIVELIKIFAEVDIKVKTSKANIIDSLDFIIASELE